MKSTSEEDKTDTSASLLLTSTRSLITLAEALYLLSAGDIQFLTYFMLILSKSDKRTSNLVLHSWAFRPIIELVLLKSTPWRETNLTILFWQFKQFERNLAVLQSSSSLSGNIHWCEKLAQGSYTAATWPGIKPHICNMLVRCFTSKPPSHP